MKGFGSVAGGPCVVGCLPGRHHVAQFLSHFVQGTGFSRSCTVENRSCLIRPDATGWGHGDHGSGVWDQVSGTETGIGSGNGVGDQNGGVL